MKSTKAFRLLDKGLFLLNCKVAPSQTKILRDFGVVHVGRLLADDTAFDLAPHHEWVHGTFDVTGTVFFCLI